MVMSVGVEDYKHTLLLQDINNEYTYSGEGLVHETFKALADSVCREFCTFNNINCEVSNC